MKPVLAIALCFGLFVPVYAQVDNAKLFQSQKALKKRLMDDAPYIDRVKFDGCRVALKTNSRSFYFAMPSGGEASRTGYFNDAGSSTTGPDAVISLSPSYEYVLDLALLDTRTITVSAARKGISALRIWDTPAGVVTATKANEMMTRFNGTNYNLSVKTKSTDKTILALSDMAELCGTNTKPVGHTSLGFPSGYSR